MQGDLVQSLNLAHVYTEVELESKGTTPLIYPFF